MNIVIDNQAYIMPMGDYNKELLSDVLIDSVFNVDLMACNEENYKKIYRVFEVLCNSITLFCDDKDSTYYNQINDLCSKMWRVDSLIVFQARKGNFNQAILIMKDFMVNLLKMFQIIINSEKGQVK